MTICSQYETTFWMDIHGELDPDERGVWEKHLAVCDACRNEKVFAIQLMGQIKDAFTLQPLSNVSLTAVVDRIVEKSQSRKAPSPAPGHRWFPPRVVLPAFAVTGLLVIAIGFFSLKSYFPDFGQTNSPMAGLEETLQTEDLEIIENMELLTEFETLQQLVQMGEEENSSSQTDEQIHGEIEGRRDLTYG